GQSTARVWAGASEVARVVANAAAAEPFAGAEEALLRADPFTVIEGLVVTAVAVGAPAAVLAVRPSLVPVVSSAVAAVEAAGYCGDVKVSVVAVPPGHVAGEASALVEALDGRA